MRTAAFVSTILVATTDAFAPVNLNRHADSTTAIHLLPSQGCQLAAASAAALAKEEGLDVSRSPAKQEEKATPTNAARELVTRMFNLPSQMMSHPSDSSEIKLPFPVASDSREDVVIYPIVGFTFVKLKDGHMRVVPSMNAKGECNINNFHKSRTQPTFGWFSPSCKLGDLHSDDEEYFANKDVVEGL
jgi:hypothetical protein